MWSLQLYSPGTWSLSLDIPRRNSRLTISAHAKAPGRAAGRAGHCCLLLKQIPKFAFVPKIRLIYPPCECLIGFDFAFKLFVEGGWVLSYIFRAFQMEYLFLPSRNAEVKIDEWGCWWAKASAYPPEQYGLIVSLYSPTCIICCPLFLMLDCPPLRTKIVSLFCVQMKIKGSGARVQVISRKKMHIIQGYWNMRLYSVYFSAVAWLLRCLSLANIFAFRKTMVAYWVVLYFLL